MGQQNGGAVVAEVRPLAVCGSRTDSYCAKGGVANDVGGGAFLVYVDKHHVHQYLRNVQSEVRTGWVAHCRAAHRAGRPLNRNCGNVAWRETGGGAGAGAGAALRPRAAGRLASCVDGYAPRPGSYAST